jgi:glycosyltransferase involved in cell wall biosynthesis
MTSRDLWLKAEISMLESQLNEDNFNRFMETARPLLGIREDLRLLSEQARVGLRRAGRETWNYLFDYFESRKEYFPAMCCAEAILMIDPLDRLKSRYTLYAGRYRKKRQLEMANLKRSFSRIGVKTMLSVIMPTYNRTDSLKTAIQSVLNQEFRQFELIVVNDGGSRECEKIIRTFKSDKIRYIYTTHGGLSHALNQGIMASRSTYISYLDDDDLYFPNHLETLVSELEETGYALVYSDGLQVTVRRKNKHWLVESEIVPYSFDFNPGELSAWNYIPILCMAHRRDCFERTGLFETGLLNMMDWELWVRFSRIFDFKHIKKITCQYQLKRSVESLSGNRVRHLFYEALLDAHFKFKAREMWLELEKKLESEKYEIIEDSISRYSRDGYQLGIWLLPVALKKKKWSCARRLICRMAEKGSLKNVFLSVFNLFPKVDFPSFAFFKFVLLIQLCKRLIRTLKRKIFFGRG